MKSRLLVLKSNYWYFHEKTVFQMKILLLKRQRLSNLILFSVNDYSCPSEFPKNSFNYSKNLNHGNNYLRFIFIFILIPIIN